MKSVLVIEYESTIRTHIMDILGALQFNCTGCSDTKNAFQAITNGDNFDLIIINDLMQKGMSGLEMAEKVLRKINTQKIIIMSGNNSKSLKFTKGFNIPTLTKPLGRDEISQVVNQVFA